MKFPYFIGVVIFLALSGCKSDFTEPCRNAVIATRNDFSLSQRSVIPYGTSDTLVYVSGSNDSLVFYTSGYNDLPYVILTDKPGNPECPNDSESFDRVVISLSDALHGAQITYGATLPQDSCFFEISSKRIDLALAAIGARDSTFRDSMSLGGRMFYNLNGFVNLAGDSFYISGLLGLLQVKSNNTLFTLQQFNSKWK